MSIVEAVSALAYERRPIEPLLHATVSSADELLSHCPELRDRQYARSVEQYAQAFDGTDSGPLPMLPPPILSEYAASRPLPSAHATPFLTSAAGVGPAAGVPRDAHDFVAMLQAQASSTVSRPPSVDVEHETLVCNTTRDACAAIERAVLEGRPLWIAAAITPLMDTPLWYPAGAIPIESYEHLIAGSRQSGIGMHRDRYVNRTAREQGGGPANAPDRPMSTYISLAKGVKHIILLPPTRHGGELAERLGGDGCDTADGRRTSAQRPFPTHPPPSLLQQVVAAGGYWFDLAAPSLAAPFRNVSAAAVPGMCVFIPAGWWHWILSDTEWHVAWSGSFFPDADREAGLEAGLQVTH